ncbi:MAG: MlaD family protein [Luteolibacter sp.]|uniref:MlaD family protein n=1 Tax=Luteolibacter sp. TaxID=1962973 RepID=UPI003267B9FB
MSKKASPTLIGIFTLVGLLMAATAVVLFGAGKIFEKSSSIILYFDQSANGLLVGSEVRFGGVRIGRVTSIKVLIDQKANRKVIPVVVQLSEKDLKDVGSTSGAGIDFATEEGVKKAVADGLRAGMKQQSLLTGQLYIEFDIAPNTPGFTYRPDAGSPYPTVPTIGTEMDELIAGIADGLKKFNALDLESATKDLRDVLAGAKAQIAALNLKAINDNLVGITTDIRALTGNEKLAKAIDSLDEALTGIDELTKKANEGFDPLMKDLEDVMAKANAGLAKIDEATADISKATNPRAPVLMRMQNTLDEVERASRAVKELANDLKRNPNALLGGKDPKP